MSGGVAFVLDENGKFQQRCNLAMVDLEPLAAEDEQIEAWSIAAAISRRMASSTSCAT